MAGLRTANDKAVPPLREWRFMTTATVADPVQKLNAALETGNPRKIAQTAMAHIWLLFDKHYKELICAIEKIPVSLLENYPVLWILHRVNPVLAHKRTPFKPHLNPDTVRNMSTDEVDMLTLAQMIAFRYSGDITAALAYASRLAERIRAKGTGFREQADGPLWFYHQQIGSTMLAAGETGPALTELAASAHIGQIANRPDAERLALSRIALAHAKRGSLEEAERILGELPRLAEPTAPYSEPTRFAEHTAAALIGVERMIDDIDPLLAKLDSFGSLQVTWPYGLLARTRSLLARRRPDEALECVHLSRDAHTEQHGSLAIDVMNAAAIDALWALGAKSQARSAASRSERKGFLETTASIRLALADDNLDFAETHLRRLAERRTLAPVQHTERIILSAWLSVARADSIDPTTAHRVAHIVERGNSRRILTQIPQEVLASVRCELDDSMRMAFDDAVTGITHVTVHTRPTLTNGELRVLTALRRQLTTAEIAGQLHVSPNTIKSQLRSIYRKLNCSTRTEAIQASLSLQLVSVDEDRS